MWPWCMRPVVNRKGEVIGSAVTNLDLHDIARACRTFGVHTYWVITPFARQRELSSQILAHWLTGHGSTETLTGRGPGPDPDHRRIYRRPWGGHGRKIGGRGAAGWLPPGSNQGRTQWNIRSSEGRLRGAAGSCSSLARHGALRQRVFDHGLIPRCRPFAGTGYIPIISRGRPAGIDCPWTGLWA